MTNTETIHIQIVNDKVWIEIMDIMGSVFVCQFLFIFILCALFGRINKLIPLLLSISYDKLLIL